MPRIGKPWLNDYLYSLPVLETFHYTERVDLLSELDFTGDSPTKLAVLDWHKLMVYFHT